MHIVNDKGLTAEEIYRIVTSKEDIKISNSSLSKVKNTRKALMEAVEKGHPMYGVNTGFGAFKNKAISEDKIKELQENLIRSHAVGVGKPFSKEIVKTMMFLFINSLSKGYSGVRPVVIKTLIEMYNNEVYPYVPEKGSVGSSGDLAPSAHLVLVMLGRGEAIKNGKRISGETAMKKVGIKSITLEAKEGLALINNTTAMTSNAIFALYDAKKLANFADIVGSLSTQAILGTRNAFDKRIHDVRQQSGQKIVAKNMRDLLNGSKMLDPESIQDQYSLRCIPQVHGAIRDVVSNVEKVVDNEVNSITDNPLIFVNEDGSVDVISGGNFHGEPVAIAMDSLAVGVSELANISDRRSASLIDPANNNGLPAFLAKNGGVNSGLMILQYTTAALVSENKVLAHPASVDSIPTSANVEDLVSMGTISARKAREIVENVKNVLAIEAIIACQAIDFRISEGYELSPKTKSIYEKIREEVPFFEEDTEYYPYIDTVGRLIVDILNL